MERLFREKACAAQVAWTPLLAYAPFFALFLGKGDRLELKGDFDERLPPTSVFFPYAAACFLRLGVRLDIVSGNFRTLKSSCSWSSKRTDFLLR